MEHCRLMLVTLGVNELLDLETLLPSVGPAHARGPGWYKQRREVRCVLAIVLAPWRLWRRLPCCGLNAVRLPPPG
jgi:hypothetical protein